MIMKPYRILTILILLLSMLVVAIPPGLSQLEQMTPLDVVLNSPIARTYNATTQVVDLNYVNPSVFDNSAFQSNSAWVFTPRFTDVFDLINIEETRWIVDTNRFLQQDIPPFAPSPMYNPAYQAGSYVPY